MLYSGILLSPPIPFQVSFQFQFGDLVNLVDQGFFKVHFLVEAGKFYSIPFHWLGRLTLVSWEVLHSQTGKKLGFGLSLPGRFLGWVLPNFRKIWFTQVFKALLTKIGLWGNLVLWRFPFWPLGKPFFRFGTKNVFIPNLAWVVGGVTGFFNPGPDWFFPFHQIPCSNRVLFRRSSFWTLFNFGGSTFLGPAKHSIGLNPVKIFGVPFNLPRLGNSLLGGALPLAKKFPAFFFLEPFLRKTFCGAGFRDTVFFSKTLLYGSTGCSPRL